MFETIFDKNATRAIKGGPRWGLTIIAVTVVCIIFAVVSLTLSKGAKMYMPGALVIVPLTMLLRKGKVENITFFVQKDGQNNIRYGYINLDGERPLFPIDEYSYWYVQNDYNNCDLYIEFRSGGKEVYLKEELFDTKPPEGWTKSDLRIKFMPGVFKVPRLEELAYRIDEVSS